MHVNTECPTTPPTEVDFYAIRYLQAQIDNINVVLILFLYPSSNMVSGQLGKYLYPSHAYTIIQLDDYPQSGNLVLITTNVETFVSADNIH